MLISRDDWNLQVRQYARVGYGLDAKTAKEYAESLDQAYENGYSPTDAVDREMSEEFSTDSFSRP